MIQETLLRSEEQAVFALRSLYRGYGYLPFRMSKFEEYELYIRNKDFLVSDRIITFNDTNGRLMALKPDVTLSIIRGGEDVPGVKQKVCYNENVYRVSDGTRRFKEIMQAGLECIGDIDLYDIYEVITLAAASLSLVSDRYALEVSHLGLLSGVLDGLCPDAAFREEVIGFIAEKNAHDLARLCASHGVGQADTDRLTAFITACGDRKAVIDTLRGVCGPGAVRELEALSALLDASPYSDCITFDFSVVSNMKYYNGFVFRGFLDGICESVLTGGQYDRMMQRMGRTSRAIGFALYLDLLEQLTPAVRGTDVDVLLLYDDTTDPRAVSDQVAALRAADKSVSAQKAIPEKLRFSELIDLRGGNA